MQVLALCLGLFLSAQAADIVVFGDSWGTVGRTQFANIMRSHGLTVDNVAIGGTTAAYFAARPNSLLDAVNRNPDARWVWLTIGGNDASLKLALGIPIPQIVEEALRDTATFLRPLYAANSRVKVVQFGYDILTFSMGICPAVGLALFPACVLDPTCINTNFTRLQFEYVQTLSRMYPGRHESVNLLGTMQAAGGIVGARPGVPVLNRYTPDIFMADCIHASALGYTAVFNAFWDLYFRNQVEGDLKNNTSAIN